MKRRNFLGLPLLAAGAGAYAYSAVSDAQGAGLRLTLLRLDGSDGTAADAARSDACWARADACGANQDWTRIALQGFVAANTRAPKNLSVTAIFAGDGDFAGTTHELFRHVAENPAASKAISFHAMRETFYGLRVSMEQVDGTVRAADVRVPLVSGLYALLLDAPALPRIYAYSSGDRARPLESRFGATPNHLVLSIAESV